MRQWTREEGYVAVLAIVKTVLAGFAGLSECHYTESTWTLVSVCCTGLGRAGQLFLRLPCRGFCAPLLQKRLFRKCLRLLIILFQLVCSCVSQVQDLVTTRKQNLLYFLLRSGFSFFSPKPLSLAVTTFGSGLLLSAEVEAVQLCLTLQVFLDHTDVVPCNKYFNQERALESSLWILDAL